MGRSAGVVFSRSKLLRPSLVRPFTLTISVKVSEAPPSREMSRIGRLVMPAMGARNTRFFIKSEPMATVFCICFQFLICLKNVHTSNKGLKRQGVFAAGLAWWDRLREGG